MQYLLLIYGNENAMLNAPKEAASQMIGAYTAYTEAMKKAGAWVGSNRLRPTPPKDGRVSPRAGLHRSPGPRDTCRWLPGPHRYRAGVSLRRDPGTGGAGS